jgi:hypothetical protein
MNSVVSERKAADVAVGVGTGGRKGSGGDTTDAEKERPLETARDAGITPTDTTSTGETDDTELDVEVVDVSQIIKYYWTYGENYTCLRDKEKRGENVIWQSKYCKDLNLHVVTEEGNDGKMVELTLKTKDKRKIDLRKIVSENNVVFDKVFGK